MARAELRALSIKTDTTASIHVHVAEGHYESVICTQRCHEGYEVPAAREEGQSASLGD